jgi:mRNA-degrading endonuclease RelE of RelBE toxin-antitoxin system
MMKGDHKGKWRMRIGEYRAMFRLATEADTEVFTLLLVTHIGTRGGIYGS